MNKTLKKRIVQLICLIAVFVAIAMMYRLNNQKPIMHTSTEKGFVEINAIKYDMSVKPKVVSLDNASSDVFYITNDSISFVGLDGSIKWESMYSFANCNIEQSKNYLAVTEYLSERRNVYVFDKNNKVYDITVENKIKQVKINDNGYIAVQTTDGITSQIDVYNNIGERVLYRVYEESNIIPVEFEISKDNNILVVTVIDINTAILQSHIIFSYINKNDSTAVLGQDGIVGSKQKDNELVFVNKFLNNGKFLAISDNSIDWYKVDNVGNVTDLNSIKLDNEIKYITYINDDYVVVAYGDTKINTNGLDKNTVVVYDTDGKEKSSVVMDENIDYIKDTKNGYIIGTSNTFYSFNENSKQLWRYKGTSTVVDIESVDNDKKIVVQTATEAQVLEYKSIKVENTAIDPVQAIDAMIIEDEIAPEEVPEEVSPK